MYVMSEYHTISRFFRSTCRRKLSVHVNSFSYHRSSSNPIDFCHMSVNMKQAQKTRVAFNLPHKLPIKRIHVFPFVNGEWLDPFMIAVHPGDDLGVLRTNVEALSVSQNLVHISILRERTAVLDMTLLENNDAVVFSDVPRRLVPTHNQPQFAHDDLVARVCLCLLFSLLSCLLFYEVVGRTQDSSGTPRGSVCKCDPSYAHPCPCSSCPCNSTGFSWRWRYPHFCANHPSYTNFW